MSSLVDYNNEQEARKIVKAAFNSVNTMEAAEEISPEIDISKTEDDNSNSLVFTENQVRTLVTSIFDSVNKRIADRIIQNIVSGDINHVPSSDSIKKYIDAQMNAIDVLLDKKADVDHTHTKEDISDFPEEHDWSTDIQKSVSTHDISKTSHADIRDIIVRKNMLDNAYWAVKEAIINQRGEAKYTAKGSYVFDRWVNRNLESVSIEADSVCVTGSINTTLEQPIENIESLAGKTVTISALVRNPNGIFRIALHNFTSGGGLGGGNIDASDKYTLVSAAITVPPDIKNTDNVRLLLYPTAVQYTENEIRTAWVKAVKLELGSAQTLAHKEGDTWVLNDPPPNKALELAKCQRYQIRLFENKNTGQGYVGHFMATRNNAAYALIPIPSSMRAIPTVISDCSVETPYQSLGVHNSIGYKANYNIISIKTWNIVEQGIMLVATNSDNSFIQGNDYLILVDNQNEHSLILDANL